MMEWELKRSWIEGPFSREALLLRLNRGSWKLIAPLPGFSSETLDEAECQLRDHLSSPQEALFPSVEAALISALLDYADPLPDKEVLSHTLLMGNPSKIYSLIEKAHEKQAKVVKFKIGDANFEKSHEIIQELRKSFKIRLDLNRRFDLQEALWFFKKYEKEDFDYIEEPLKNPWDLSHFPYPFALDETLREKNYNEILHLKHCSAIILKPTLMVDIRPFLSIHPRPILSHCFEGKLGMEQMKQWAIRANLLSEFHGLDSMSD